MVSDEELVRVVNNPVKYQKFPEICKLASRAERLTMQVVNPDDK